MLKRHSKVQPQKMFSHEINDEWANLQRTIIYTGETFIDDEGIEAILKEMHSRYPEFSRDELTTDNFQIKMPISFRKSIFNNLFYTDFKEKCSKYKCRVFSVKEQADRFDVKDMPALVDEDDVPVPYEQEKFNLTCDNCTNQSTFHLMTNIKGTELVARKFPRSFCNTCAKKVLTLENEQDIYSYLTNLIIDPIVNIILNYCRLPFEILRIGTVPKNINALTDWIQFLSLGMGKYGFNTNWLINVNLKSPLYGWILSDYGLYLQFDESIEVLERKFRKIMNL